MHGEITTTLCLKCMKAHPVNEVHTCNGHEKHTSFKSSKTLHEKFLELPEEHRVFINGRKNRILDYLKNIDKELAVLILTLAATELEEG